MIPQSIAGKVLLIGPDYKNHRGGIGAVIDIHKDEYEIFHFIPTYKPYKNNLKKAWFFLKQFGKIFYFLATHRQIKIVHIHSSKQGSFYRKLFIGCMVKMIFRKKTINHIHSGNFRRFYDNSGRMGKKMIHFFLKLNDCTITVSGSWKSYFEDHFSLRNVHHINNTVAFPTAMNGHTRNGVVHFLFLGMIHPDKGIFDLLQVLRDHKPALVNKLKLYIGGFGQVEQMNEMIGRAGLDGLVEYKGWVSGRDKDNLLQFADVFVLPSYYEGVPVAILEAMSYKKPVIATAVGGIPEIVQPGLNGWLHQPGDHNALLNAILHYINEPESIKMHGEHSYEIVKNYFPQAIMPQLESVYRSLL